MSTIEGAFRFHRRAMFGETVGTRGTISRRNRIEGMGRLADWLGRRWSDGAPGTKAGGAARLELGRAGEALAERFLSALGYELVERSCRSRLGEIDLVMRDGDAIVFVEVKARGSDRFGFAEEAVGPGKRRRLALLGN